MTEKKRLHFKFRMCQHVATHPHMTYHFAAIMASFSVEAMVRSYHVYKDIWATVVSEELPFWKKKEMCMVSEKVHESSIKINDNFVWERNLASCTTEVHTNRLSVQCSHEVEVSS